MESWRGSFPNKIRNIRLVPVTNQNYQAFLNEIRLRNYHFQKCGTSSQTQLLGYALEETIREWVGKTSAAINDRIICYEQLLANNRYEQRFKEIDLVFSSGEIYFLTEIKVSTMNKIASRASDQLVRAYNLLMQAGFKVGLVIIFINLNFKKTSLAFNQFNEDFLKVEFTRLSFNDLNYLFIHLKPHQIFKWGISHGIISDPDLLAKALEESETIHLNRMERKMLKWQEVPEEAWPEELKESVRMVDEENSTLTFEKESGNNILAEKLREALNNKSIR